MKAQFKLIYLVSILLVICAAIWLYGYLHWQTFTNKKYGYTIRYPKAWIQSEEKTYVDEANKSMSVVNLYKADMKESVSVEVSHNDLTVPLRSKVFKTNAVKINGTTTIAYIFKSEYNECQTKAEDVCGYLLIPLHYDNVWYIIGADGSFERMEYLIKKVIPSFKLNI
jgi:uncharacterized protein (UPF0333 family)